MLIESYTVEFKEVRKCIAGMQYKDFIVVSQNIFTLTEKKNKKVNDLLADHTSENHPEALLLVSKDYAKNLILNEDSFEFLKQSHDIKNLNGVTLHLAFANQDLIDELDLVASKKLIDGVAVRSVGHEALLLAQQQHEKRYKDNKALLKKSIQLFN